MDLATLIGILVAIGGIVGGMMLEGGKLSQILQPTAAFIVFGGTIGATLISFPLKVFLEALKGLRGVFFDTKVNPDDKIKEIVAYANRARKEGMMSLEQDVGKIEDPFLKRALTMAVDGIDPKEIRQTMELVLAQQEEHLEQVPKVFEAAGGYAPTIGIIGAVLGLIQVMQHLDNIDEVGKGIAVAFVATVYGVGAANIFFLPAAGKLKLKQRIEIVLKEMILEGVISILEGVNPRLIEDKLRSFFSSETKKPEPAKEEKQEKAA